MILHPAQREAVDASCRLNIIRHGRRWGATHLARELLWRCADSEGNGAYIGRGLAGVSLPFEIDHVPDHRHVDSLRGASYDIVVVDGADTLASFTPELLALCEIATRERSGQLWIFGTRRVGFFGELFAQCADSPAWYRAEFGTATNSYADREACLALIPALGESVWREEFVS